MYHSTIPQRTQPITADDFQAAAQYGLSPQSRDKAQAQLGLWNDLIQVKPQDLVKVVSSINLNNLQVDMDFFQNQAIRFRLSDGDKAIEALSFGFESGANKNLLYSMTKIKEKRQGIGTRALKAKIEVAMALNVPSIVFSAGLSHGGFVWARRGFEIDQDYYKEKPSSLYYLGKATRGRLSLVKDQLPQSVYETCAELTSFSQPDDITRLAHQDHRLTLQADDFDLRNIYRHSALVQAFAQASLQGEDEEDKGITAELHKIGSLIDEAKQAGQAVTLGQYLLYGSEWRAKLDLSNHRQMQKIERHMGAFHFIKKREQAPSSRSDYCMAQGFAP